MVKNETSKIRELRPAYLNEDTEKKSGLSNQPTQQRPPDSPPQSPRPSEESMKNNAKKPTNREIVDAMMGEFIDWMKDTYGFEASYQEARTIAISLFWSEFVFLKRQSIAQEQQDALDSAEKQLEDIENVNISTVD